MTKIGPMTIKMGRENLALAQMDDVNNTVPKNGDSSRRKKMWIIPGAP